MNVIYRLVPRATLLQCPLRSLMLWTTLIGFSLGLYVQRAKRQSIAVRGIIAHGGVVYYDAPKAEATRSDETLFGWMKKATWH